LEVILYGLDMIIDFFISEIHVRIF